MVIQLSVLTILPQVSVTEKLAIYLSFTSTTFGIVETSFLGDPAVTKSSVFALNPAFVRVMIYFPAVCKTASAVGLQILRFFCITGTARNERTVLLVIKSVISISTFDGASSV